MKEGLDAFRKAALANAPFNIVFLDISSLAQSHSESSTEEPEAAKEGSDNVVSGVVKEMRELVPTAHIVLLTLSDAAHRMSTARLFETFGPCSPSCSTCGYLTKPIKRAKLLRAVRAAIVRAAAPQLNSNSSSLVPVTPRYNTHHTDLAPTAATKAATPTAPILEETVSSPAPTPTPTPTPTTTPSPKLLGVAPTDLTKSRKVLVVEDNKVNQKVVLSQLAKLGYTADTANNGKEAVEMVQEKDYALVLMDVAMPILDGFQATEAIRELHDERYRRLPIIALTASVMDGDYARCHSVGMNDFLSKPLRSTSLAAIMTKYYNNEPGSS